MAILFTFLLYTFCGFQQASELAPPYDIDFIEQDSLSQQEAVLYVFTGSDWCRECKRLEKEVLENAVFSSTMVKNGIQIQLIDFPQRKKLDVKIVERNESIAEKYNFEGVFPTLVISPQNTESYQRIYYQNENSEAFSQKILNELRSLQE